MASKIEADDRMEEDCNLSEAEDGELIDDITDPPAPPQVLHKQDKLQLRARRFGIVPNSFKISHPDKRINKLYARMGVTSKSRLEALHMFGVDNMKTQDIFAYFETTPPLSVEWISDKTCNAVWLDEKLCALALLSSSIRIKGHNIVNSENIESGESSDEEEYIKVEDLRLALPPGIWRKGSSKQYAPSIFLRFATHFDKKKENDRLLLYSSDFPAKTFIFPDEGDEKLSKPRPDGDNPWSDIARRWGHFEQKTWKRDKYSMRDARELIKNREPKEPAPLRDAREILNSERMNPEEGSRLFGKMQADIEERKILRRQTSKRNRSVLCEMDLRQRLGNKRSRIANDSSKQRSESSDEEELGIKADIIKERVGDETWLSEINRSSEESDSSDDAEKSSDLRHKLRGISKPFVPRSPLRIEIDNDIYYSGNASDSDSS